MTYAFIQQYHNDVFAQYGVGADAWTPNKALNWLTTAEEKQALWDSLVQEGPVGSFLSIIAALANSNDHAVVDYVNDLIDAGAGALNSISNEFGEYSVTLSGGGQLIGNGARGDDLTVGSQYSDVIMGFNGNDEIRAGDGDDRVYGGDGDDNLLGGDGDDIIAGGAGKDVIAGGAGNDHLAAGRNAGADGDYFAGGSGDNTIVAGDGDDIINTGWDGDFVPADENVETSPFLFPVYLPFDSASIDWNSVSTISAGGGNNVIRAYGATLTVTAGDGTNVVYAEANKVTIELGTSTNGLNVIGAFGRDIEIASGSGGSVISVDTTPEAYGDEGYANIGAAFITGEGGMNIISAHNLNTATISVGDGNDTIYAEANTSTIYIGGGDNTVSTSLTGNHTIVIRADEGNHRMVAAALEESSADGDNFVNTGNGDDQILMGTGNDYLSSGDGTDLLSGGAGNDTLFAGSGSDRLEGGDGSDYIYGGAGDDMLLGSEGSDTYTYASGDGSDYLDDEAGFTDNTDVLILTNLNADDLTFTRSGVNLILTVVATNETITLDEQYYSEEQYYGIERIDFADGSSWNRAQINASTEASTLPEITVLGTTGNDTLTGTWEDDVLYGDKGNDLLLGSAGSDIYIYASGDGADYLDDEAGFTDNTDVLMLTNLNASDVTFARSGVNLVLTVTATNETITLDEEFYSEEDYWGIERIDFADGSSMNREQMWAYA